jgi:hypothetical protein
MNDWTMGSTKEGPFVEMRRALFERFIRELAKYEYLIESKEFQIFAHEAGEVDKRLVQLPKQQPMQILEKYRLSFKIDEDQDATEIAKYREKINMFVLFLKKADGMMEVSLLINTKTYLLESQRQLEGNGYPPRQAQG